MANAKKAAPDVEIEIAGKKYTIIFNLWVLCLLEKETGKNALGGEMWLNPSATDLTTLLWAALTTENPEITIQQVGSMLTLEKLGEVSEVLKEAFEQALPDPKEGKGVERKNAKKKDQGSKKELATTG